MPEENEIYSLVTVTRIETFTDIASRKRGKKIEFAVIYPKHEEEVYNPETRIVKEMITQLKNIGLPILQTQQRNIKLVLYILPEEEEAMKIQFKVNNIYKMIFEEGSLKFEDVTNKYYFVE